MQWAYVAGFFDGEGCIQFQPSKSAMKATFVQSTKQHQVLYEIAEFLKQAGITCNIRPAATRRIAKDGRICEFSTLAMSNAESLVIFYSAVLPFLIVKRAKAVDALVLAEAAVARKQGRRRAAEARMIAAIADYKTGMSIIGCRRKHRVHGGSLRNHLIANGVPVRDREAAVKHYFHSVRAGNSSGTGPR